MDLWVIIVVLVVNLSLLGYTLSRKTSGDHVQRHPPEAAKELHKIRTSGVFNGLHFKNALKLTYYREGILVSTLLEKRWIPLKDISYLCEKGWLFKRQVYQVQETTLEVYPQAKMKEYLASVPTLRP